MTMPSENEHPKHTIEYWKQLRSGYHEEHKRTPFETVEALHAACAADDLPRFKDLLDQWATLGFSTFDLNPIIVLAIYRDNVEVVSLIYSQGDDHSKEIAPFFYQEAFQYHAKKVLTFFIQNGWDLNAKSGRPTIPTAPAWAVEDEEMTRWLLEHGADPNVQAGLDLTPLSWAAAKGSLSTIKLLFEYGADIHKGQPLHHATKRKSEITEVLAFLLKKGAPLDEEIYENHEYSRTVWGRFDAGTPLFHAIMWRNMEAIQYLVERGADVNIKSRIGQTPLEFALDVDRRENREIAALLKSTMEARGQ